MTSTNAHAIRQARVSRTRTLRRRVIAGAVALFIAAWLVIALVLVSGHDPALAAHVSTTTQTTTPTTSSSNSSGTAASSSGSSSSDNSGSASSGNTASASSSPSSVTTHSS